MRAAREKLGPLDALVVNHARSGRGRLDELTATQLDAFLHENVRASLLLVKEFAAQFEADARSRSVPFRRFESDAFALDIDEPSDLVLARHEQVS